MLTESQCSGGCCRVRAVHLPNKGFIIKYLLPYIELAKPIVGTTANIHLRVSNCKREDIKHQIYASISKTEVRNTYNIFMYRYAQRCNIQGFEKYRPYTIIELLHTLAHELAHIPNWTHTTDHKILECRILIKFMQRLSKEGYISEEKDKEWAKLNL